jgi:hypothetical protein
VRFVTRLFYCLLIPYCFCFGTWKNARLKITVSQGI